MLLFCPFFRCKFLLFILLFCVFLFVVVPSYLSTSDEMHNVLNSVTVVINIWNTQFDSGNVVRKLCVAPSVRNHLNLIDGA